jgi:hypothetical protein
VREEQQRFFVGGIRIGGPGLRVQDCTVCGGFRDHIPPLWDLVSRASGFGSRLDLDRLDWIIFFPFPMISASYSIPR